MFLDQLSILVAIGFSGASLGLTLFMMWVIGQSGVHLLNWSFGLGCIVIGVALFSSVVTHYDANILLASFLLLMTGFAPIYVGSAYFCSNRIRWKTAVAVAAPGLALTTIAFMSGYSGVGTIIGNLDIGLLLALAGHQYWRARAESPLLMIATAALYMTTALSFMACGYALLSQGQFILQSRPENWAEQVNSIVVIVGLTGIGTLSLTLHQARIANRHKVEAMTDALTGLLNRRALFDRHRTVVSRGTAVIVMDLDHFKTINDRFGHDGGDLVLSSFAKLLLGSLRSDDIAARIGGEEFCLVLPNATPRSSAVLADGIRVQFEAMALPNPAGIIRATVSVGLTYATEPQTLQSLISRADRALYQAKTSGRNCLKTADIDLAA